MGIKLCKDKTVKGKPCEHRATVFGYCTVHYRKLTSKAKRKKRK